MSLMQNMEIFVIVVQNQSFTKASEKLNVSKSYVSKIVTKLETDLDAKLLNRTTRHLSLTEAGRQFFYYCQRMIREAEKAIDSVNREQTEGTLKISMTQALGNELLPKFLGEFTQQYPNIKVDALITNRLVDIMSEGFDIAVRLGPLESSDLYAKKVLDSTVFLLATPEYIKQHGAPSNPTELSAHKVCSFTSPFRPGHVWRCSGEGEELSIDVNPVVHANSTLMVRNFMLTHQAIGLSPHYVVKEHIERGELVPIMTNYQMERELVFILFAEKDLMPKKIRDFIDGFAQFLMKNYNFKG